MALSSPRLPPLRVLLAALVVVGAALACSASRRERRAEPESAARRFLESLPRARAEAARAEADRILRARSIEPDGYVVPFAQRPWLAAARTPEEASLALSSRSILVVRHLEPLPPQTRHSPALVGDPSSPRAIDGLEPNHHHSIRAEVVRALGEVDRPTRARLRPESVRWEHACYDDAHCDPMRAAIRDRSARFLVVLERSERLWFLSRELEQPLRLEPGSRAEAIVRLASRRDALASKARSRRAEARDALVAALVEAMDRSPHDRWAAVDALLAMDGSTVAPALARFVADTRPLPRTGARIANGPWGFEGWGTYGAADVATLLDVVLSRLTAHPSCGLTYADDDAHDEPRDRCAEAWQSFVGLALEQEETVASIDDEHRAACAFSRASGELVAFERDGEVRASACLVEPDGTRVGVETLDRRGTSFEEREIGERCLFLGPITPSDVGETRIAIRPLEAPREAGDVAWPSDASSPRELRLGARAWRYVRDERRFVRTSPEPQRPGSLQSPSLQADPVPSGSTAGRD